MGGRAGALVCTDTGRFRTNCEFVNMCVCVTGCVYVFLRLDVCVCIHLFPELSKENCHPYLGNGPALPMPFLGWRELGFSS